MPRRKRHPVLRSAVVFALTYLMVWSGMPVPALAEIANQAARASENEPLELEDERIVVQNEQATDTEISAEGGLPQGDIESLGKNAADDDSSSPLDENTDNNEDLTVNEANSQSPIEVMDDSTKNEDRPALEVQSTEEGLLFRRAGKNAYITGTSEKTAKSVEIPQTIDEAKVVGIDDNAFRDMEELRSIVIPPTVRSIGSYAFYNCARLTAVDLSKCNEIKLGDDAFSYCERLVSVALPANVNSNGAPFYATAVTNAKLSNGMTAIPDSLFYGCGSLPSIDIPDTVRSIGSRAFYDCSDLTSIEIPDAVRSVGYEAFCNCERLATVDFGGIPELELGDGAFRNCTRINTVALPASITAKGASFYGSGITTVVLAEGITAIPDNLFAGCEYLSTCNLPDTLQSIGEGAFEGCSDLKTLDFPASLRNVGARAFSRCVRLERVDMSGMRGITLGADAFSYCSGLTDVLLPAVVNTNGSPFENSGVSSVTLSEDMTEIPDNLFNCCPELAGVELPEGLRSIGQNAFAGCAGIEALALPSAVTRVGSYAFSGCTRLSSLVLPEDGAEDIVLCDGAFARCERLSNLSVPANVRTEGYSPFANSGVEKVTLVGTWDTIPASLFAGCELLTAIEIPTGVKKIEDNAFYGCASLESAILPNTLRKIGYGAFRYCNRLSSIAIPSTVWWIGYDAFADHAEVFKLKVAENSYAMRWAIDNEVPYEFAGAELPAAGEDGELQKDGLKYRVQDGRAYVTGFANAQISDLVIPDYVDGCEVVGIDYGSFSGCTEIQSLTLPNTMHNIDSYAFSGCNRIVSIDLGNSDELFLGYRSFADCSRLTSIHIPRGIVSADSPFYGAGIKSADFASEMTNVPNSLFSGCSSLADVTLPQSLRSIGDSAFSECSSLVTFNVPMSLSSIGSYAFSGCVRLSALSLAGRGEISLGYDAFADCQKMTTVALPARVITNGAPFRNAGLRSATLAEGMSSIPNSLFSGASALSTVSLPDSVRTISEYAFENCQELVNVSMPSNLSSIEYRAFGGCGRLVNFNFDEVNEVTLGSEVFEGCSRLLSITLPKNVETRGAPFDGSSIQTVVLVDGMREVPDSLFYGCERLSSVTIPSSIKKVGSYAFYGCTDLESIVLSKNINSVGHYAFYGCKRLSSVDLDATSEVSLGDRAFEGCTKLSEITIPQGASTSGAPFYGSGLTRAILPDGLSTIPDSLFSGCELLSTVNIPDSVCRIGANAFDQCVDIESVSIPARVREIGWNAFYGCSHLTNVEFGTDDEIHIGGGAFQGCIRLSNIVIPAGATSENSPFSGSGLESATLEPGMTRIPNGLFDGCSNLHSVSIPDSLCEIGDNAFYGCTALTEVTLPNNVNSIGSYAFCSCKSLGYVYLPEAVVNIGYSVFNECSQNLRLHVAESSYAHIWAIDNGMNYALYDGIGIRYDGYLLNKDATSFYTTTNTPGAKSLIPLTLTYKVDKTTFESLDWPEMYIKLSPNMIVLDGSLTIDGEVIENYSYDQDSGSLHVPVTQPDGRIQLTARVLEVGGISSYSRFNYYRDGSWHEELIGVLSFESPELTISAPDAVGTSGFVVSGITSPSEIVDIYCGDKRIGQTTAKRDGTYAAEVMLAGQPANGKTYAIAARLHSDSEIEAVTYVRFVAKTPKLVGLDMYYNANQADHIDLADYLEKRLSISIVPGYPFTFKVRFDNADDIANVYVTSSKNGVTKYLEAKPTATTGLYIASGYFDESDHGYAPGTLGVSYVTPYTEEDFLGEVSIDDDDFPELWKNADITTVLDDTNHKKFEVTLTNGENVEIESKAQTLKEFSEELLSDTDSSDLVSHSEEDAAYRAQDSDAAVNILNKIGQELAKKYTQRLIVGGAESANEQRLYVGQKDGALDYYLIDPAKGTVQTLVLKAASSEAVQKIFYSGGKITEGAWKAGGAIVSTATGIKYGYDKHVNVDAARTEVYSSSKLTESEKQRANKCLDDLDMAYMALTGLKIVGALGVAFCMPAAAPFALKFAAGVALGVTTDLIGNYLDRYLSSIRGGSIYSSFLIDPSGYVFEAVTSNRISGATVTAYYRESMDDEPSVWDAEEYSQMNPLVTGSTGLYAWDTPEGFWQVKVEKDGYDTWLSEWLPVPPIQDEVNAGLVSHAVPEVEWAYATAEGARIKFTKYMDPHSAESITLTDGMGNKLDYELSFDSSQTSADGKIYANEFVLSYDKGMAAGSVVNLELPDSVKSYAGVSVSKQELSLATGVQKNVEVSDNLIVKYGEQQTIRAHVEGAVASDALMIKSESSSIARVASIRRIDNQNWDIVMEGRLPGETTVTLTIAGTGTETKFHTQVQMDEAFGEFAECKHISGNPQRENEIPATCTAEGSYDEVTYCTVCGEELSRFTKIIGMEEHSLSHHEGCKPTAMTGGSSEYWECSKCHKLFTDASGRNETTLADLTIPAVGETRIDVSKCEVSSINEVFTGNPVTPKPTVTLGNEKLTEGKDYELTYENNTNAGEAKLTVIGKGDYTGSMTLTFEIAKADSSVSLTELTKIYNGKVLAYSGTVNKAGSTGAVKYDYYLDEACNKAVETANVKAAGTYYVKATVEEDANHKAATSEAVKFTISKAGSTIKIPAQTKTYTGKSLVYSGKVVKTGSSGKVTYAYYSDKACKKAVKVANVKAAGTYYVKATVAADANHKAATSKAAKLTVAKATNPMKLKAATSTAKLTSVKKKAIVVPVPLKFSKKAQGKVTYAKVAKGSSAALTVNKSSGKVTVRKGTKKGAYTIKIKVTAAGNANYKALSKTITCKVVVK